MTRQSDLAEPCLMCQVVILDTCSRAICSDMTLAFASQSLHNYHEKCVQGEGGGGRREEEMEEDGQDDMTVQITVH